MNLSAIFFLMLSMIKICFNIALRKKNVKISPDDNELIRKLKLDFKHIENSFYFKDRYFFVDRLVSASAPGTLEQSLTMFHELFKSQPKSGKRLLNVGSGTGSLGKILGQVGFDVFNMDIMILNEDSHNFKVDFNCDSFPFSSDSFEWVYCSEVIEHVENPWFLFREINRVLKRNGVLILTTPNIHSCLSKFCFLSKDFFTWFSPGDNDIHINALPFWEIKLIAGKNNFEMIRLTGNGEYYFRCCKNSDPSKTLLNNEILIYQFRKI